MRPDNPLSLAIGGLIALAVAMGIGRFVYTPILPLMIQGLGLSQAQAGLIAAANFAGYLAGALLAANPAISGSRRKWLLGSLLLSTATTGLMGLGHSVILFMLVRFAGGVASAFAFIFSAALVLDRLSAAGKPHFSALYFAGVGTGIALAALLVSVLVSTGVDWRQLWFANALFALAATLLVAWLVPDHNPVAAAATAAGNSSADNRFKRLIAAYGLFGFGYVITATFIVAQVRATPLLQPLEPVIWLIVGLTAAPSVALWTWLARRFGLYRMFAVACLLEAVGVAAGVLWVHQAAAIIAAALLGGTFMGITALGLVGARALSPGNHRRVMALMTAAFGLGQIIGPIFAGQVHDVTGSFTAPSLIAAGALVVAGTLVMKVRDV